MLKINNIFTRPRLFGSALRYLVYPLFAVVIGWSCQSTPTVVQGAGMAATPVSQPIQVRAPEVGLEYLLGQFDPATHPDFIKIGAPYTDKPGMMLRRETFQAFEAMWKAAEKEGVLLKIISSTRNFEQQKKIWEGKWARFEKEAPKPKDRALKILEYSSMPGSSRHHWGSDIDLNDLNNPTFEKGGKYEKVYRWLSAHAHEYGFCQPYTAGRPNGYQEEKWHWSYTPLSKGFLSAYKKGLTEANISGFKGAEMAAEIGIVRNYVLGINEECQ